MKYAVFTGFVIAISLLANWFFLERPSMSYQPIGKDGDYRISISGGRQLVCEEQDLTIAQQPTAVSPIILECKHKEQP